MYGATVTEFNCSTVARMPPRSDFLIKAMGSTAVATFRRRTMEDAIEVAQEYKKLGAVAVMITTPEGSVVTLEEILAQQGRQTR
jgi:dihydrodipicolinate synthase/N-acetylneuraminate lyase